MKKSVFDVYDKNDLHCFKLGKNNFYYNNKQAFFDIYKEVFVDKIYEFKTEKVKPVIIDAGSNIGLSTLFFKMHYPQAIISCFEPDLHTFTILKKNILENELQDVSLTNAAVSNKNGFIQFYGDAFGKESDSRGNSIFKAWGNQRDTSTKVLVKSLQLSKFINEEVDFLKLDIEGAEQQVLEELGDKLKLVKEITLDVHESINLMQDNSLQKVCEILNQYNFELLVEPQDFSNILPNQIKNWVQKEKPKFYIVNAKRKS